MSISVERFLQALTKTGIITPAEAEMLVNSLPAEKRAGDADELARDLVRQGKLTRFQAAAIYQNKADGLVLGNYLILDKLGAGGMGQVFRARHRRMDRVVAIKVLSKKLLDSPDAVARFQREVKAAARLTHPNIVTAYDADEAGGLHFLVMEYVDGSDLAAIVKQQGALPVNQALDYLLQAARGLEHAHGEGVVHRDIKPSNLLLDKKGTLKILDMGLARMSDPLADPSAAPGADLTHSGSIMGTIDYMAPEQAMDSRQADARSDIYSLGCTFHYLLTGRPPYGGDTVLKRLTAHQQAAIPLLSTIRSDIPPAFDEVFGRMMAKRSAARFQTSKELVAALESLRNQPVSNRPMPIVAQAIAVQPVAAVPATPIPSGLQHSESIMLPGIEPGSRKPRKSSSKLPLVAAAVVVLLAAAGAGVWMMSGREPDHVAQSEAKPAIEKPQPAAESSPAKAADPKPAAEPLPRPTSIETAPVSTSPAVPSPEPAPDKIEPPVAAPISMAPPALTAPAVPSPPPAQPIAPPAVASPTVMAAAPQPTDPPAGDEKLPVPSADSRRESQKLIKELYKDDYAQAKTPEAKSALAEKLLNESEKMKDDATAFYCVLLEARDLAVEAANPALAERAISMIAGRFAIEPLKELAAALDEMAGKPHPADANRAVAETALARVDEAQAGNDFDTAEQLANVAATSARKSRDSALSKRAIEVGKNVAAARQQWATWRKALDTLSQTPNDPAANFAVGRYLCFVLGDWSPGLAHLAKGQDGPLKDLATKSLQPPTDAAALADLGDSWFAAAEKAKGKDKADLRAGAAYWYSQAEPGLSGLVKTVVEKRLKDLGGKVAVAPSGGGKQETIELNLAPGVSIQFRLIPAGKFVMGSPPTEPGRANTEVQHDVTISKPFYLGITELTQAQWQSVMGNNPSAMQGAPTYPVEKVSPSDVQQFLTTLNQSPLASAYVFRLPTEAEWEYACRAGTTTAYSFGDDPGQLKDYAWFADNSGGTTHPVGQLKPNPWGLYDMHGNVWEWCSDWTGGENYYLKSASVDPKGPESGTSHANRGGSEAMPVARVRSATRGGDEIRHATYGFRLACEPVRGFGRSLASATPRPTATPPAASRPSATAKRPVAFAQADIERNVAKWVLSISGKIRIVPPADMTANPVEVTDAAQLPTVPFVVFSIELSNNEKLTDADLARVAELMNLVELKVNNTSIGDAGLAHIGRMTSLVILYLHRAKISDAGLPALANLKNLTNLYLTGTKTSDAGFVHLRTLTNIRHLGLQNTGLTDTGIKSLAGMTHLRWLGISQTKITDATLKMLALNSELNTIELIGTKITDAGLMALRSLPVVDLNMGNTSISDQGLQILATLPGLKHVQLPQTKVTDAGVQRFKAAQPNCEVVR